MNQFQSGIWAGALGGSLVLDTPIARYYAADAVVDGGGKVTMWPPRFGNPLNVLSTPDPARRPGFSATGGHGGGPCLTFDGTQGLSTNTFYLPVGVTDIALLTVYKATTNAGQTIVSFGSAVTGSGATGGVQLNHGFPHLYVQTTGNAGANRQRTFPIAGVTGKFARVGGMGYLSDPHPETAAFVNGVIGTGTSANTADNTSYFNNVTALNVGHYAYTHSFLIGSISEIHIYPRLTTADFLELDAQVAATYPPFP